MKLESNVKGYLLGGACLLLFQGMVQAGMGMGVGNGSFCLAENPQPAYCTNLYNWRLSTPIDLGASGISGHRVYVKDFTPNPAETNPAKKNLKSHPFTLSNSSTEGHCLEISPTSINFSTSDFVLWFKNGSSWVLLSDDEAYIGSRSTNYQNMPVARIWLKGTTTSVSRSLVLAPYSIQYENDEITLNYSRIVATESQCTTGSGVPNMPWVKFIDNNTPVWGKTAP
ncbi:MAG TPA: hypothetical protein VJ385_14395 [Fibrobacteria bacterium]|nr:hypothetical protein [Fibrobacteria bacterium]